VRGHCAWAREFASWVDADARFERAAPVPFALVCFRLRRRPGESAADADARSRALVATLNATGRVFLTHTALDGRYTIRLAVGARATERRHVVEVWEMLRAGAGE
jgi:aromatic-L-amino-acid decarboxylase